MCVLIHHQNKQKLCQNWEWGIHETLIFVGILAINFLLVVVAIVN